MHLGTRKHERLRHRTRPLIVRRCALDDMFPKQDSLNNVGSRPNSDPKEAIKLLKTNIAGEFSPRTLPQDKSVKEHNKMTIDYGKWA